MNVPTTPRVTTSNNQQDKIDSPNTVIMDQGDDDNRMRRYDTRSSSGSYKTIYGREVNPPKRLTTGAFHLLQEAITLVIMEENQSAIEDFNQEILLN